MTAIRRLMTVVFLVCAAPAVTWAQGDVFARLSDLVMTRHWPDGSPVDQDSPTPLLWGESDYLLKEPTRLQMTEALQQIEGLDNEAVEACDPVRRAVLQRQLWSVFDWASSLPGRSGDPIVVDLQVRVARALKILALPEDEIRALPDTIRLTPRSAMPRASGGPELPTELSDPAGPWVCLRRVHGGLIAPAHSESSEWRSVFLVLMRTPDGRRATLEYLNRLNQFPEVLVSGSQGMELNPATPQFPVGTQFALVERPLLISDQGRPVMSPLCFRIQMRSYRTVSERFVPQFSREPTQLLSDYVLRPRALFAGTGAMTRLGPDQDHYATFFTNDPFQRPGRSSEVHRAMNGCMVCHGAPGILSVNSRAFTQISRELPVQFRAGSAQELAVATIAAKTKHHTWGLLQGIWRHAGSSRH